MPLFNIPKVGKATNRVAPLWTQEEDDLLIKLKNKNVPYADLVEVFQGRTQDSIRSRYFRVRKLTNNEWTKEEKIGFLDIESSGFSANFDNMLSWCIKLKDGGVKSDVITRKDLDSLTFDRRITESLLKEISNLDVLVTYYGTGFDIPFIRTRALMNNLDFFAAGTLKHIDLYYAVKYKLKLGRNSLEQATMALGIEGKTHVLGEEWRRAKIGNRAALDYVLEHNKLDVLILEKLYNRLVDVCKFTRKTI